MVKKDVSFERGKRNKSPGINYIFTSFQNRTRINILCFSLYYKQDKCQANQISLKRSWNIVFIFHLSQIQMFPDWVANIFEQGLCLTCLPVCITSFFKHETSTFRSIFFFIWQLFNLMTRLDVNLSMACFLFTRH